MTTIMMIISRTKKSLRNNYGSLRDRQREISLGVPQKGLLQKVRYNLRGIVGMLLEAHLEE